MELELDKKYASESIREYSYRMLWKNIIYLKLKPGEAISENTVAEALHTSRTPIRETFAKLLSDGLLDVYPQRGTYVSLIDMKRVGESVFMRVPLEEAVMERACRGISEEYMYRLESNLNRQIFCYAQNKLSEIFELDNALHETIYRGCGMEHVWQAIQSISADQYRIRYLEMSEQIRSDEVIEEHRAIIQAIRDKDSGKGCKITREHIVKLDSDVKIARERYPLYFKERDQNVRA